mmetsp:Transcript_2306/g.5751  ORF Transcript_2306/g.5751 Transcript_2306/m.5751 type:complete len:261 (+) Transcript_2306:635-1417(+)
MDRLCLERVANEPRACGCLRDAGRRCKDAINACTTNGPDIKRVHTINRNELDSSNYCQKRGDGGLDVNSTQSLGDLVNEALHLWVRLTPKVLRRASRIVHIARSIDGKTCRGQVPHNAADLRCALCGSRALAASEQQLTRRCWRHRLLVDEVGYLGEETTSARGPIWLLVEVVPLVQVIGSHIVWKPVHGDVSIPTILSTCSGDQSDRTTGLRYSLDQASECLGALRIDVWDQCGCTRVCSAGERGCQGHQPTQDGEHIH